MTFQFSPFARHVLIKPQSSPPLSRSLTSHPPLCIHSIMSLKYAMACRYAACLAGGGAPPGQAEGAGGGAHRGEAQPAQVGAPESPLPPDTGLAEVCPATPRAGNANRNWWRTVCSLAPVTSWSQNSSLHTELCCVSMWSQRVFFFNRQARNNLNDLRKHLARLSGIIKGRFNQVLFVPLGLVTFFFQRFCCNYSLDHNLSK